MKKKLLYFLCSLILSCSSGEDSIEELSIDEIVGKWYFYSYNIGEKETIYNKCSQKGNFTFSKDGFGKETTYWNSGSAYGCIVNSQNKLQWSLDGTQYDIKTFTQGGYGGILTFPITYQYYGEISNDYLKIPVGNNEIIKFVKKNN